MKTQTTTIIILTIFTLLFCKQEVGKIKDQNGNYLIPIPKPNLKSKTKQIEVVSPVPLHQKDGILSAIGWARQPMFQFDRSRLKTDSTRVKYWEHYTFYNEDFGGAVTISDIGSLSFGSAELIDLKSGKVLASPLKISRPNSIKFPNEPGETVVFEKDTSFVRMKKSDDVRLLSFSLDVGTENKFTGELIVSGNNTEGFAVITPYPNEELFFYEFKQPGLEISGKIFLDGKEYNFSKQNTRTVQDWGRGGWPEQNQWLWASGSGSFQGEEISFNLGYGFGEIKGATENGYIYKGKAYKLDLVSWIYDVKDYNKPWKFTSNDGRFEMDFTPIYILKSDLKLTEMLGFLSQLWKNFSISEIMRILKTKAYLNKAFGYYKGYILLESGKKLTTDKVFGFAEQMVQTW